MKKIVLVLILLSFIGLVVFRLIKIKKESENSNKMEDKNKVAVTVIKPTLENIESTLVFVGDILGEEQAFVFSEASGNLIEYKVKENDTVKKDDVIVLIDRAMTGMDFEPLKVKSPISGIIGRIYLDKGANIDTKTQIALVVKMEKVKIALNIPEKYLTKIYNSMESVIKVNAYPDKVFIGKITKISPVLNTQDRTFYAEINLDNPGHLLRPGMFAEIKLIIEKSHGLILPGTSVRHNLETKEYFVFLEENGKAVKKVVVTGIIKMDKLEIKSGLSPESKVINLGSEFLQDGDLVEVIQ